MVRTEIFLQSSRPAAFLVDGAVHWLTNFIVGFVFPSIQVRGRPWGVWGEGPPLAPTPCPSPKPKEIQEIGGPLLLGTSAEGTRPGTALGQVQGP